MTGPRDCYLRSFSRQHEMQLPVPRANTADLKQSRRAMNIPTMCKLSTSFFMYCCRTNEAGMGNFRPPFVLYAMDPPVLKQSRIYILRLGLLLQDSKNSSVRTYPRVGRRWRGKQGGVEVLQNPFEKNSYLSRLRATIAVKESSTLGGKRRTSRSRKPRKKNRYLW